LPDKLLSPLQVCETVGICKASLYKLLALGELRASKIGRRTVISSSELQRFIDSRPAGVFRTGLKAEAN
jgi:excisionase family DNA binding protein